MFLSQPRIPSLLCVLCLLLAGVLTGALIRSQRVSAAHWREHRLLYLERGRATEALIRRIAASPRFQGVVSRYTSEVSFNTFAGMDSVPIAELADRLDPLDPRYDPYMKAVERLFGVEHDRVWEVVYLRTRASALRTYLLLQRLVRDAAIAGDTVQWRLPGFQPLEHAVGGFLFLGAVIVVLVQACSRSVRLALVLAACPCLVPAVLGPISALLAGLLILPAWLYLYEYLRTRRYNPAALDRRALVRVVLALLAACVLAVVLNLPGPVAGTLAALAGGIPAAGLLLCLFALQDSRRAHSPYQALPILRRFRISRSARASNRPNRAGRLREPRLALYLLLGLIVLGSYPALHAASRNREPLIRMAPVLGENAPLKWGSLAALSRHPGTIPDLSDYLTHRAYQESLLFGRPYAFPIPGERIRISEYRLAPEGGRVLRTSRVVKRFEESWLRQTLDGAEPGSVPRLLADQGYAGAVQLDGEQQPVARTLFSVLLALLYLLQFLLPGRINLTASVLYATRNLTLRRY